MVLLTAARLLLAVPPNWQIPAPQGNSTTSSVNVLNFPVTQEVSLDGGGVVIIGVSPGVTIPVSGTFTSTLPDGGVVINGVGAGVTLPVTGYVQATIDGGVSVTGYVQATVDGGIAIASLWDGGVIVENFPATQAITLPDGGVVINGVGAGVTFPATQSGSWYVQATIDGGVAVASLWDGGVIVENFPATQAVTQSGSWYVQAVIDGGVAATISGTVAVTLPDGGVVLNGVGSGVVVPVSLPDGGVVLTGVGSGVSLPVTESGSWYVQAVIDGGVSLSLSTFDAGIPASGMPVGGVVLANGSQPVTLNSGSFVPHALDYQGRTLVNIANPNPFTCNVNGATAQTQCEAPPGSGLKIYVTDVTMNVSSTAENLSLVGGCDAGNTTLYGVWYLTTNGGLTKSFVTPISVTANQNLCCNTSSTGNFSCSVQGYIAP